MLKRMVALGAGAAALVACQPATPQVVKETVVVEPLGTPTPAPKEPVELTAAWLVNQEYWQPQIDLFRQSHPDINVKFIDAPVAGTWTWGAFFDKVATLIAGGVPIDTVRVPIEGAKLVVALGIVRPLDEYMAVDPVDEAIADIDPALMKPFQLQGKTWAIPFDFNDMLIWYNSADFEEAGIEPPSRTWTYEEFLDVATKLTKRTEDQVERFGFVLPNSYGFQSIPWVFNRNGSHLSDDWNEATMDTPEFLSGIDFMRDMIWTQKVATTDPDPFQLVYSGKASMVGGGRWPTLTFIQNNLTTVDVTLWPQGGAAFTEFGVGAQWMTQMTEYPDEVWQLLKFMTTTESQGEYHSRGAAIAARKSVALSITSEIPNDTLFYQAFETTSPKPVPSPPDYSRLEEALVRGYQETVLSNARPTKDVWAGVQEEVSQMIGERPPEWQTL